MRALLRTILSWRRIGVLIGVAAACLLVWFFGGWLFGAAFADAGPRLLVVAAIIALWLTIEAVTFRRRHRANARMLDSLQRDPAASLDEDGGDLAEMKEQIDRTFALLRSEKIGHGLREDFLYALPYYLLIGPPLAGKASLVTRSGLPMAVEKQAAGSGLPMRVGGHRMRWWFAEDGLLITTRGGEAGDDRAAASWQGLLGFLSRHRPRRPVDAVVVVVDTDTLLSDGRAQLAGQLRARLQEAMRIFSIRLPIYVVVSKCDRLAGFADMFRSLDEAQRIQALGTLMPRDRDRPGLPDPMGQLRRNLPASLQAVSRLVPFAAAAERDPARRARIVGFPEQLAAVTAAVLDFTAELVHPGRRSQAPMLRGVFFTAAGGSNSADDRLVDGWTERFVRPMGLVTPPASMPVDGNGGTQSYFVTGLFQDCIFPEAGLAGRNPKVERRMAALHVAGYLACLAGLVASGLLWFTEYRGHRALLNVFSQAAKVEQAEAAALPPSPGLGDLQPLLDQARAASQAVPPALESALGFSGLHVGAARDAAIRAYDRLLGQRLLPVLLGQLGQQLRHAISEGKDAGTIRSLLAVYLMMGDPEHYAKADVSAWGAGTIDAAYGLDPGRRTVALDHLSSLLDLMPLPVTLDQRLIADARTLLRQRPDADRVYAQLRDMALRGTDAHPIDVVEALGTAGAQLLMLRSQAGLPVAVPAFYTRDGFYRVFVAKAPALARNAGDTDWVLGGAAEMDSAQQAALLTQVTDEYVRDYVKAWQSVVSQMALRELPDLASLVSGLQTLASPDSPLVQFVQLVTTQTDLPVPAPAASLLGQVKAVATGGSGGSGTAAGPLPSALAGVVADVAGNPLGGQIWPGDQIKVPFAALQGLIGGQGGRAPALRIQDGLTAAYGVVSGIASSPNPDMAAGQVAGQVISGQGGDPLISLRVQAASLPRPLDSIVRDLYQNIWRVLLQMTRNHVQAVWARTVAPVCEQSIGRRYPFVAAGDGAGLDVTLRDFADFFGPKGVMDSFVTDNLAAFTSPGRDGSLTLSSQGGLALDLSREALAQINRARRIRSLFFDANGNLAATLTLTPSYLDPRVLSANLSVGASSLLYRHQPPRAGVFRWPFADGSDGASLTFQITDGRTPSVQAAGPWSLFRLIDTGQVAGGGGADRMTLTFQLDDAKAGYTLRAGSVVNPFADRDFRGFRCVPRL